MKKSDGIESGNEEVFFVVAGARPTNLTLYYGTICTAGNYCPSGSNEPRACSAGYYSDAIGIQVDTQCVLCKNGNYCPDTAMLKADMVACPAGQYCIE